MSRIATLTLAVLALTAVSGCDEMIQQASRHQGPSALQQDEAGLDGEAGECVTCAKFRTRPPSGINAPPSL